MIEPKKRKHVYDKDLVLVLSDWTDENPKEVLRTLKRGSEWYSVKKQTEQSLYQVIKHGAFGAQLQLWRQRMPGMDISDVYYPAFLINGKENPIYPQFKGGERIRLRVINAGASTYFQLSFGAKARLIAADGVDVRPASVKTVLHAIGETYDFLLTLPPGKSVEVRAAAQDGSGFASAVVGKGPLLKAPVTPRPNLFEQMKQMAKRHGSHKHPPAVNPASAGLGMKGKTHKNTAPAAKHGPMKGHGMQAGRPPQRGKNPASAHHGMQAAHRAEENTDHHNMSHSFKGGKAFRHAHSGSPLKSGRDGNKKGMQKNSSHKSFSGVSGYRHLRALKKTKFAKPLRVIHLNLTGNMRRYVWSMNGKTLSESDVIKIDGNEAVRLILHNQTMMHHPMHLHGHFFRVLNRHGDYSPLKHTVDVPPMENVTIEFAPNEKGDWFFHCHVLYHMKAGMARVFRHGRRDLRLKNYPLSHVWNGDRQWHHWGSMDLMTNRADLRLEMSNTRNRIRFEGVFSWVDFLYRPHKNYEWELDYSRFLTDIFRIYGGAAAANPKNRPEFMQKKDVAGRIGFRWLLPYLIDLDVSLDHKARLEVELEYELLLASRLEFFASGSWRHFFNKNETGKTIEWLWGLSYAIRKPLSLKISFDSHFGYGGGIHWRF